MNGRAPKLWLRQDLVHREVWFGNDLMWVVKDPLSKEFLYFNQQEHIMLLLADGQRTLAEIVRECATRFAPQYFSSEAVLRFFSIIRERGFLVAGEARTRQPSSSSRSWWHNPLAIRFPGFSPDMLLDAMYPFCRRMFNSLAALPAAVLFVFATVLCITHFHELAQNFSISISQFQYSHAGILLVVVAVTKIIHELAHAMVCRHFGCECREIGVMLLFGVPCLYCDVSDAWTIRERWKRILVSGAGMIAEVFIASIAVLVWNFTNDAWLRDLSVIIIVTCSVSTLLVNGNPLLRYDGYYIASDLLGIPNLAAESRHIVTSAVRRFLWGMPAVTDTNANFRKSKQYVLAAYAILSTCYRWALILTLLLIVYLFADAHDMGFALGIALLSIVAAASFRALRTVLTPPDRHVRRSSLSPQRPRKVAFAAILLMLVLINVPLPKHVSGPMSIEPGNAITLVVPLPARIEYAVESGTSVRRGRTVAQLRSLEVERNLLATRNECDRLTKQIDSIRRRRATDDGLSTSLPLLEQMLTEATTRKALREVEAKELILQAPNDGVIYAPPETRESLFDVRLAKAWYGSPLDEANQGAWLESGTEICIIGDPSKREALVLVCESDIETIRVGQDVTLLLESWSSGSITGTVAAIADSPIDKIADEISAFETKQTLNQESPRSPQYSVRVKLGPSGDNLPVRLVARASICVEPESVLKRFAQYLDESLRR